MYWKEFTDFQKKLDNSVGSLGVNGGNAAVSDVQVTQCTFNQTMNGARIKTWPVYSFLSLVSPKLVILISMHLIYT